jgi:hypothetical protein
MTINLDGHISKRKQARTGPNGALHNIEWDTIWSKKQ